MVESPLFEIILALLVALAVGGVIWFSLQKKKQQQTGSDIYLEALEYLVEGNEGLAIQKFKDAIRYDSEKIAPYLRLGDLLRKKGMISNAIRIHRDLTLREGLSKTDRLKILKSLLRDYKQSEHKSKGLEVAKKILELQPKVESWVVETMLEILEARREWAAAEEIAGKYQRSLSEPFQKRRALYLVFQGLELQEAGKGKEARIKFKDALKKDPRCEAAYYYLGQSYLKESRLNDAVEAWKKFCQNLPEKAHIIFPELEKAWFELGQFAEAENLYQEMLSNKQNRLAAGLALAEIYHKKGEHDRALEVLNHIEEDQERPAPAVVIKKAAVLFSKGQYKQAAHQLMANLNHNNRGAERTYQCRVCQYRSKTPLWLCPGCQSLCSFDL